MGIFDAFLKQSSLFFMHSSEFFFFISVGHVHAGTFFYVPDVLHTEKMQQVIILLTALV